MNLLLLLTLIDFTEVERPKEPNARHKDHKHGHTELFRELTVESRPPKLVGYISIDLKCSISTVALKHLQDIGELQSCIT